MSRNYGVKVIAMCMGLSLCLQAPVTALAASPEFARTTEEWAKLRDNVLEYDELEDLIINKAKLWLDSGKIFGDCGRGFQRINIACPRATLTEALERIRDAMKSR